MLNVKLVDRIVDSIIQMIQNKEYDSSCYLPTTNELSEIFEVSRTTIREALCTLEVRGFVCSYPGKGVQVVDNSVGTLTQSMEDILWMDGSFMAEVLATSSTLESTCAKLATLTATKEDIEELESLVDILDTDEINEEIYCQMDWKFRTILVNATKNRIYQSIFTAYTPILEGCTLMPDNELYELENNLRKRVLSAIKERKGEKAKEGMSDFLNYKKKMVHVCAMV